MPGNPHLERAEQSQFQWLTSAYGARHDASSVPKTLYFIERAGENRPSLSGRFDPAPPSNGLLHAADIGMLFTVVGILTVASSVWHYTTVQEQIRQQRYRSSSVMVFSFSTIIIVLGLVIVWYLLEGMLKR